MLVDTVILRLMFASAGTFYTYLRIEFNLKIKIRKVVSNREYTERNFRSVCIRKCSHCNHISLYYYRIMNIELAYSLRTYKYNNIIMLYLPLQALYFSIHTIVGVSCKNCI